MPMLRQRQRQLRVHLDTVGRNLFAGNGAV